MALLFIMVLKANRGKLKLCKSLCDEIGIRLIHTVVFHEISMKFQKAPGLVRCYLISSGRFQTQLKPIQPVYHP